MGEKSLGKPSPMVPSILNTLINRPFKLMLPAWICDAFATAIIGSLTVFFVRYIVQPEDSNGCNRSTGSLGGYRCSTTMVLGIGILLLLGAAGTFLPLWLYLAKRLGKRNAWLLWSISSALTNLVMAFVTKGNYKLFWFVCVLNGIPMGAKFLSDAIMADIIDYDEFLTGSRAEATYTMFKGFLPKIAAIPASALPIALLGLFGHVDMVGGEPQEQPQSIRNYISIVIIWVPTLLFLCSFCLKLRFPLICEKQYRQISEGVALHNVKKPGKCPCSGHDFILEEFDEDETVKEEILANFPALKYATAMLEDQDEGKKKIMETANFQFAVSLTTFIIFACISGATAFLLFSTKKEDIKIQFIPVLSIVFMGTGLTMTGLSGLRLLGAHKIMKTDFTEDLLRKVETKRKSLELVMDFDVSMKKGMTWGFESSDANDAEVEMAEAANK
jgi:hypothetical protein